MYPSQVDIRTLYSYTRNEGVHKYDMKPNASLRKKLVAELDMTPRGVQVRLSPSRPLGVPSADQQFDALHPPFFNATSDVNGSTIEITLSSMRLLTVRDVSTGSTASSIGPSSGAGIPQAAQRLSVDLAHLIMNAQGRPSSILSSGSSLQSLSTISGISVDSTGCSARSSSSSVVSHDHEKEHKEKEEGKKTSRESRRSSESHRRTPISEIFPETQVDVQRQSTGSPSPPGSLMDHPMVRMEEATADGHSLPTDNEKLSSHCSTLRRTTSLINYLDLEVTPGSITGTPLNLTPWQHASQESPLRRCAMLQRGSLLKGELHLPRVIKLSHMQSKASQLAGQQIAPWNELDWKVSPWKLIVKPKPAAHLTHKCTLTPSPADAGPVFQPPCPAKAKAKTSLLTSELG
ncbi:hypothetical protein BD311DRAFT_820850 [Dichomitus squalens]|uniref:Uncharacterized protein n=1 Tax=Dichomitus squalens TaxID=114155 RepID=A0A4Q9MA52_9APHY|nr:hypothetical protein BD311DRAFT_820850 [Dichomitus squalens]